MLLPAGKPLALLCYLAAISPRPASRQELTELLWQGGEPHHLRQALYILRRACAGALGLEGQTHVRYVGISDLTQPAVLDEPFLDGLDHLAAPAFNAWLAQQRQHWEGVRAEAVALELGAVNLESTSGVTLPAPIPADWMTWALAVWGEPDPEAVSRLIYGTVDRALEVAAHLAHLPPQPEPSVPEAARLLLHHRAARMLEASRADADVDPGRLARHYLQAQDGVRAAEHLLASARTLMTREPTQAREQALRALWASEKTEGKIDALFMLEQLAELTRQGGLQVMWLAELERLVFQGQHDDTLLRLALVQAQRRQRAGRLEAAVQAAETAQGIARRLGRTASQHEAQMLLGVCALGSGRLDTAAGQFRALLASKDQAMQMRARLNLGVVQGMGGRSAESLRHFERGLTLARSLGHRAGTTAALGNLAGSYEGQARYPDAARMARESYQLATQDGQAVARLTALLNLAEFERYAGNYGPCWNTVQEALELVQTGTPPELHSALFARQGMLELRFGRLAAARKALSQALELAQQSSNPRPVLIAQMQLALLHLCRKSLRQAAGGELAEIAGRFRAHGYGPLADLTELHAVWYDPKAKSDQLLLAARKHSKHSHPHMAWLAAVLELRATGKGQAAVKRGLDRFQFAEAPEALVLLGQPEEAHVLRLEQARGLPDLQRRALLKVTLEPGV